MIKTLKKVGNSNALILDKALLELVGLKESGKVQITIQDGSIIITPTHPVAADPARFQACLDRVVKKRRSALKRLAE